MNRTVVVGVDGSARSRVAMDWAAQEARRRGLPLRPAHIVATDGPPDTGRVVPQLMARYDVPVEGTLCSGGIVPRLLDLGANAELVVVGMRGAGGHAGLRVGSVALGVASRSPVPVALVPFLPSSGELRRRADKVTVGLDAREPAEAALDFALDAACRRTARLHALHIWSYPPSPLASLPFAVPEKDRATWEDQEVQLLSDVLRPWREKYPDARVLPDVFLSRIASDALVRASASAAVIVVGRRHEGRLGRTVLSLLQHSRCPVVVVPS
ncbi:universal stress protein [Actinomycetota bacterium Odt1-20B]